MNISILALHPVIRIVCLLILGGFTVLADPKSLLLTAVLLLLGFSLGQIHRLRGTGRILLRLKWLFFSIFLIYLFLTPGASLPLLPQATVQGLELGVLRLFALILFIAAVNLLISSAEQAELTYAILWLLRPLRLIRFPVVRFAVRMALTLDYVSNLHEILQELKRKQAATNGQDYEQQNFTWLMRAKRFIDLAATRASFLFQRVLQQAETNPQTHIEQPIQVHPQHWQWLVPALLLLLYTMLL